MESISQNTAVDVLRNTSGARNGKTWAQASRNRIEDYSGSGAADPETGLAWLACFAITTKIRKCRVQPHGTFPRL
jgi:hypothetical protein